MARYRKPPQVAAVGQRPLWLEAAGQRRLQAMHARLRARRQLLERWTTLVAQIDDEVTQRLEGMGAATNAYDIASAGLWDDDVRRVRARDLADEAVLDTEADTDDDDDDAEEPEDRPRSRTTPAKQPAKRPAKKSSASRRRR